jgi:hypothetical protein
MEDPPNISLGDWLISLFTRRREARREVRDMLESCLTAIATFRCTDDGTPREAHLFALRLGPDAARVVLNRSQPAACIIRIAREHLAACQQTPGYNPNGRHTTKTHRLMYSKYRECRKLIAMAESRMTTLSIELRRTQALIERLPSRFEAYNTQLEKLRRVTEAQFWNGVGSGQAMGMYDSAATLFAAAQLAWEQNEPFLVDALLNMIEEPFNAMDRYAGAVDSDAL